MTTIVPIEIITSKIYLIRGQKVMLDRDLAGLYGVETRVLKQAVRRNIRRFPSDLFGNKPRAPRGVHTNLNLGTHVPPESRPLAAIQSHLLRRW